METRPFQFTGRIRSFGHAIAGVIRMGRCQHNAWIHLVATAMVIAAGFFFHFSPPEWCWIVLAVLIVWRGGALKTAVEFLADGGPPNFLPCVGDATGVGAAVGLLPWPPSAMVRG